MNESAPSLQPEQYPVFCAGLDPSLEILKQWALKPDARGLEAFNDICTEALAQHPVPVKLQMAFYEQFGARGIAALQNTIRTLKQLGCAVILDAKRGDIGSTAAAYAQAWLGSDSASAVQAITVHPYLGMGALQSFFDAASERDALVFVVVRSSNPEGSELQQAQRADGTSVAESLCDEIAKINHQHGKAVAAAVLGATLGSEFTSLATRLQGAPILAPGIGAQGVTLADFAEVAGTHINQCILPVSRALLASGPDPQQLAQAVASYSNQVREHAATG